MDKKYTIVVDAVTGETIEREYTAEEYAADQEATSGEGNNETPSADS
jgi:hypothetical protein